MDLLYPLKFKPIYKERIWGGRTIAEKFARTPFAEESIGEAWELSDYPGDESEIADGIFAGKTLFELIKTYKTAITGTLSPTDRFPLLVKILDPADKLSVQVHPDNKLAGELEGTTSGKTEMWLVLEADPGASVICGTSRDVSADEFEKHLHNATLEDILNKVPVAKNDVIFIPARTVHAILPGMLLLEVQQTSDTTYRLYDWGRVDKKTGQARKLHIEKGLKSSELAFTGNHKCKTSFESTSCGNLRASILKSEYFSFDRIKISEKMSFSQDGSTFHIVFCLGENCAIRYAEDKDDISLKYGEVVLIPAGLSDFSILGNDTEIALVYLEN